MPILTFFWLMTLALPLVAYWWGRGLNKKGGAIRLVLAVTLGWLLTVCYVELAYVVALNAGSEERILEIYAADGAKFAFARVFGWVPSLVVVLSSSFLVWIIRRVKLNRESLRG